MVFVHADQRGATVRQTPPSDWEELTVTNSFGMPSLSPPFLLEDIGRAKQSLAPGQLLIVSVVGTLRPDRSYQDDFVAAALLAKEAGAPVIEANFSCPNVGHKEGSLYLDPDAVFRFAQSIVRAIAPLPLLIKVGAFPTPALHKEVFLAAARAGVQGIAGINSVPMQISLSPSRSAAGVCGAAIRHEALRFVRTSRELIDTERLELSLLGCGGIVLPSHFDDFLEAGAHLALSATGMMWNPYLAIEWRKIDASQRARPVPV
jgi:dihydroorotate dehydrogenase